MKFRYSLLTLAVAMGLTFGLSSCTEEDTPVVPGTDVGVATGVMVNTMDANTITAKWTRAADDTGNDTLWVTEVGTSTEMYAVAFAGTSTATVNGLSSGKLYNVQVGNSTGNRTTTIEWATAVRSGVITIYETSGSTSAQPSGLALSLNGGPATAVSVNSKDSGQIDLVLATDTTSSLSPAYLSFQAANVIGSQIPTGKATKIDSTVFYVSGGLDNDYYSSGFASRIVGKKYYDEFASAPANKSAIVLVHTEDGHYARVEVKSQPDGKLYRMVGGVKAIDCIVSYQTIANKAYASRPVTGPRVSVPKLKGEGAVGVIKNEK
jgi:hypothetical protein